MHKALNGQTAGIVVALALAAIALAGYFYIRDPPKIGPEQMRKNMAEGMRKTARPNNGQGAQPMGTGPSALSGPAGSAMGAVDKK